MRWEGELMKCIYTVFAMLLVLISLIAPTAANEADWMPDANLRTAVRSALDIDAGDTLKCIRLFRPQFRKVKIRFVVEIP